MKGQVSDEAYPGAMEHIDVVWARDPFHVLISTVLSQRTRDQNTYSASKALFARYDSPGEIASADLGDLVELVRPAGFPQVKAKAIKEICRRLHQDFDDAVPSDIEVLLTLPMVGRKTAFGLGAGLGVILCVGETIKERQASRVAEVLGRQLSAGLADVSEDLAQRLVVAGFASVELFDGVESGDLVGVGFTPEEAGDILQKVAAFTGAAK